ncbi:hypothetical protein M407DRAFT_177096 [Tulasnella calospora MUT 4182]|uniref:Uncharacterized protein n=1 Tax=Tulasnella calospora MUT 4182 TaxID=1051891 RepID=A0A0C3PR41_9AGAM|nr:hypothetical protein M407DRAFT_177096 [Tulasnella calospora MUT 4182]
MMGCGYGEYADKDPPSHLKLSSGNSVSIMVCRSAQANPPLPVKTSVRTWAGRQPRKKYDECEWG